MTTKISCLAILSIFVTINLLLPVIRSQGDEVIPENPTQLQSWFDRNVLPLANREATLDPSLIAAEANMTIIKVAANGKGDFRTIQEAVVSIPAGNKKRVIISIAPGTYTEKIQIGRYQPFITFYGDPNNMPTLIYNGTAAEFGTMDSATVAIESEYFMGINLKIVNSAPRPDGVRMDAQAVALRVSAEKAAFYNCQFHGYQDTLFDEGKHHFYKDCYVEGTVDFIFGNGKTIFLNTIINVISGDSIAFITAHSRANPRDDTGYSFAHSTIAGRGGFSFLGRPWRSYARVIFAYSELSDAINQQGWFVTPKSLDSQTVYFGEYKNWGLGSGMSKRANYTKKMSDKDAQKFIELAYINGSTWLLPPPKEF